ncbi:MAG: hypothetical protein ACXVUE_18970 [Solirubrobacteraceae bacterium]
MKPNRSIPSATVIPVLILIYPNVRANGARILMEPTDFEYGERQYTAEDIAGHQWTFSETLRDVAPEEWGGILVDWA